MSEQQRPRDNRPDPDALLELAKCEGRGRLKVFLGAAPGVGKTFAMLSAAKRLQAEGVDVVVGLVETHGRSETAALLDTLEQLPRHTLEYKGRTISEFDLDGALARRPELIIVDELAHTNAPDSRHPKRYQDVEELIAAGIDVWTALNIQHLESLSDVVSRITGVAVRETVPDTVLAKADDVVLVDITPEELLERLKEGKVYLPENAKRAADNFFKSGNLTALRELALRRTADRVDDQMVSYLRQNAIEGPWPTAERLMVLVGPDALSELVVRNAGRLASALNASWVAATVERIGAENVDADQAQRVDDVMRLAERLGAETARLTARDLPTEILRYARRENITQIVIGRSHASRWQRLIGRSLTDEMMHRSTDISIHVVTDAAHDTAPQKRFKLPQLSALTSAVMAAVGTVALAVLIGIGLRHWVQLPNLSMVFLTAVLFCAVRYGLWSAIGASMLSFLAYNFFFIEPIYTFTIAEPHEFFALVIFLLVAVLTGSLAARVRDQAERMRHRAAATQSLYEFSRKLSGTANVDDVLWAAATHAHAMLGGAIVFALSDGSDLTVRTSWPPEDELGPGETAAARWAFEKRERAGWGTGTLPNTRYQFHPLVTARGVLGVCGVAPVDRNTGFSAENERILSAILDQTAIAVDRALLVGETAKAAALVESEKLRAALLSSISHDLRTPLASITGAVTSLRELGEKMPPASRQDLLVSIEEEAGRLSRFVANLLDMTRIESGGLDLTRDWVDIGDVVRDASQRARKVFNRRPVETKVAGDLPLVRGDSALLGQVVFNLIDNAEKYAGPFTPTEIAAWQEGMEIVVTVTDDGPGIPAADLERVFEKFYRGAPSETRAPGTGLGLAICRGIISAMGGTIKAESPVADGHGTRLVIRLPAAEHGVAREAAE